MHTHTHTHTGTRTRTHSHYLKHPAAFFSPWELKNFLPWQTEQCHQRYMTPLPLTCTIVRIMLSDHFNRLPGYRFSWVCRMRDEAGSWGGVLKNNTKCSIPFLQSRETDDKPWMRRQRGECARKHKAPCSGIHVYTDRLSSHSFWSPSTPQSNPYLYTFAVFCRANPFIAAPHKGTHAQNRKTCLKR